MLLYLIHSAVLLWPDSEIPEGIRSWQIWVRTAGIHLHFALPFILVHVRGKDSSANFLSASAQSWSKFLAKFIWKQLRSFQLHLVFTSASRKFAPDKHWFSYAVHYCEWGATGGVQPSEAIEMPWMKLVKQLIFSRPFWKGPSFPEIYAAVNVNYPT